MKIAAVLETDVSSGGGFNQALNSIIMMAKLCKGKFEFVVYTNSVNNIGYLADLNIRAKHFKIGLRDSCLRLTATNYIFRSIQSRLQLIGPFEKSLINNDVDLVYFVTQGMSSLYLQRLNYISTVWDTCHRDLPEFPEVREYNKFIGREYIFNNSLTQALVVLVDSSQGIDRVSSLYGVDKNRIIELPFSASPFINSKVSSATEVLSDFGLEKGYYLYPAQFWPHKNHVRILQALEILNSEGIRKEAVFVGGNKGNESYLRKLVDELGLKSQVHFLGFVDVKKIKGLYEGCGAVVMPTYFGPTNLPPLEAWSLKRPLIYSAHLCGQTKGAAVLADPDCALSLANAMKHVEIGACASEVVQRGVERLEEVAALSEKAQAELMSKLVTFEKRLQCWS